MGKKNAVRIKQIGPKAPAAPLIDPSTFLQPPANNPLDEIHLPAPPDRKYQIQWPLLSMLNANSTSSDMHDYMVIYPAYLDATRSLAQGRRISARLAVSPSPTVMDLSLALQRMNIHHLIQPYKGYSRDHFGVWDNPGRVMVLQRNLPTDLAETPALRKRNLLRRMAAIIQSDLPERQARIQREADERDLYEHEAEEYRRKQELATGKAGKVTGAAAPSVAKGNPKKKGKKGRK